MIDLYLKTPDLETMQGALADAGVLSFSFPALLVDPRFALDYIGNISTPTGNFTTVSGPDGSEYETPEYQLVPGLHANLRVLHPMPAEDPEQPPVFLAAEAYAALEPYLIPAPTTPLRVWAE